MRFLQSALAIPFLSDVPLATLLVIGTLACALGVPGPPPPRSGLPPRLSLLTLGDTGEPPHLYELRYPVRQIGAAMAAEDRARPVQALVSLGDNFYPRSLRSDRMQRQIQESLATPFCHFIDPGASRAVELARACRLEPDRRHPVPILAVLGNHDYGSSGSPLREHAAIPRWIPNWRLAADLAVTREFEEGLSLILVDSTALIRGAPSELVVEQLRRSRGPWRILALHNPIVAPGDRGFREPTPEGGDPSGSDPPEGNQPYRAAARRWIAEARVPVQLVLSGHEHNLELIPIPTPLRGLQVIVDSGSRFEAVPESDPARDSFVRAQPGFARIDLVGRGSRQRLEVRLFAVAPRLGPGRADPWTRGSAPANQSPNDDPTNPSAGTEF